MLKHFFFFVFFISSVSISQAMVPAILAATQRGVLIPAVFGVPYILMHKTEFNRQSMSEKFLTVAAGMSSGGVLGALGGVLSYTVSRDKFIQHAIVCRAKQCGVVAGMTAGFGILGCWGLSYILPLRFK